MDPHAARHTCLKLHLGDGAVAFVKGTWFASHFQLSVTDGNDAWTCDATEAEVRQRAEQWDQPVPEYIAMAERYLGFQQPGSVYRFEDAGNGQKRLSWTFEKLGTRLEWRWKCQPSLNNKQTTLGILDFLMDANIRLSMGFEKVDTNKTVSTVKHEKIKGKEKKLKGERVKAAWDDTRHAIFIKICLNQMRAGNKLHRNLNKLGYLNLEREFYKQTGIRYYRDQFKNHWDSARRDWQAWDALRKETGIGWDKTKRTYSQTKEWWAEFAKRFPGGDKFAYHPLDHVEELDMLFGEGSLRGDAVQSPFDEAPYADTGDSRFDRTPESHAEAEEPQSLLAGNQNTTPTGSPGFEEFGEIIGSPYQNSQVHAARSEKRSRSSDGLQWETCIKQVYDILMGGSRLLAPSNEDPSSIPSAIALLNKTHGIQRNSEEWLFAASKFQNGSIRQLFFALGDPDSRAAWIKREYRLAHKQTSCLI